MASKRISKELQVSKTSNSLCLAQPQRLVKSLTYGLKLTSGCLTLANGAPVQIDVHFAGPFQRPPHVVQRGTLQRRSLPLAGKSCTTTPCLLQRRAALLLGLPKVTSRVETVGQAFAAIGPQSRFDNSNQNFIGALAAISRAKLVRPSEAGHPQAQAKARRSLAYESDCERCCRRRLWDLVTARTRGACSL